MIDFGQTIAGGTIAAAGALIQGSKIAINWCGGWHHAQRYMIKLIIIHPSFLIYFKLGEAYMRCTVYLY